MANIMYWFLAILMFGLLVLVHELGHFWAARLTGIGVVEFAVGFGPKIASRTAKSGVLYSLRALPLGGYCRFVADDEDGAENRPDAYYSQKIWKRVIVSLAGPVMNLLLAVLLLFLIFSAIGLPYIDQEVGNLMPGYPAESAGILAGDRIVSVNGAQVQSTAEIAEALGLAGATQVELGVERSGNPLTIRLTPQQKEGDEKPMIGIEYTLKTLRLGFGISMQNAFQVTGDMALSIFRVLRDLIFTGEGAEDLSGPIGTVVIIREQTETQGILGYFQLASLISVNLGIFNMLPIPGLDGSKIIFLAMEKIRGKRLDPHKEGTVLLIGFAVMFCVMLLAMYQDIRRLIN